ncbi:hypothetical protein QUB29_18475, partial [Microcoleus sp. B4b_D2]
SKKDGRDAHPTITIKIVSYLIRDPKFSCKLQLQTAGAIALYLHPLPLKPRKSRPQCDRIGICGFAQYDRALGHFRF